MEDVREEIDEIMQRELNVSEIDDDFRSSICALACSMLHIIYLETNCISHGKTLLKEVFTAGLKALKIVNHKDSQWPMEEEKNS